MKVTAEIHAARMRLRSCERRLRELEQLPKDTPENRAHRQAVFKQFWHQVGEDADLVKAAKKRPNMLRAVYQHFVATRRSAHE